MSGAALLVGLLLLLTRALGAKVPGAATFIAPEIATPVAEGGDGRRPRGLLRAFVLSPIHPVTWAANASILIAFPVAVLAFGFVAAMFSAGASTLFAGIGLVFIAIGIEVARLAARAERWRAGLTDPRQVATHPYRALTGGGLVNGLRAEFADENRWRDVLYVGINLPLVLIEGFVAGAVWLAALALVAMPIWYDAVPGSTLPLFPDWFAGHGGLQIAARFLVGAALLPIAASISQLIARLHRPVVVALLGTSESRELRRQVESLRESRSAALDAEATELRRIERDLHDGAQQRLVMLAIDLGLASEKIESDPAAAKRLVLEGRDQAQQALAELRDLVRGLAPAILLDRGLAAALDSIAARLPIATTVQSDLAPGERLADAVERAGYFVVAESLANVAKHSRATRCEVRCRRNPTGIVVEVWDDGAGGAAISPGGGLAGLARRVEAVDGSFSVSSPPGGPTLVRAELPV